MIFWFKRNLSLLLAALGVFLLALAKAFHLGKKSERHKQTERALKTANTRFEVENEVNQKSDSDVTHCEMDSFVFIFVIDFARLRTR